MTIEPESDLIALVLARLQQAIHAQNQAAGWWATRPRNKGEMLMLIVSEISEAMEAERQALPDAHLPHRPGAEVELADAVIRILDYCEGHGYDLAGALLEKMQYNQTRLDHQFSERKKLHGKKW